jgi:hypothetical protein
LHTGADRFGILHLPFIGELLVINTGDFDVNIDTVDERATDLLLVAGDGHCGTTAFFDRIAVIAAGAGVRVAVVQLLLTLFASL